MHIGCRPRGDGGTACSPRLQLISSCALVNIVIAVYKMCLPIPMADDWLHILPRLSGTYTCTPLDTTFLYGDSLVPIKVCLLDCFTVPLLNEIQAL